MESVKGFQGTYGLEQTGIIDERTYARIFDVYSAIILSLPDSVFIGSYRPYPGFVISLGFDGDYMIPLQTYLRAISTVFPEVPAPELTGVYDTATENAVRAYQELSGMPVTGVVNLFTWNGIGELYGDIFSGEITSPDQYPGYVLSAEVM